jgi:hypothetical protein
VQDEDMLAAAKVHHHPAELSPSFPSPENRLFPAHGIFCSKWGALAQSRVGERCGRSVDRSGQLESHPN